jgi:AbrB family looped-hinge helix DNA binding protein
MSRKAKRVAPTGFGEEQQAMFADGDAVPASDFDPGHSEANEARLQIGPGGRIVIPSDMRAALGVEEGDTLLASVTDGELRLMSTRTAIARAQAIVGAYIKPGGPSLVDELLADRRAEVAAEQAWADNLPKLGNRVARTGRK